MYNKGLFSHWVPKPLMLFLIIIMLLPILALNGVYTSTASDISGALATYAEYIILANNATAIGMSISILICIRIKSRFRSKEIIAGSCILLSILCYIIATTDDPMVLIWGSFMIGFVKVFPMVELIMPIMFMIAPNGDRGKFYAIFYPCSIAIGQLSSYVMSTFILNATWQAPYFIMAIIMILVASVSILFQHNQRFCFKTPLYQIDWVTLFLLSICGMSFNYFFTFMKQQDWFESDYIILAGVLGVAFFLLTIHRQKVIKRSLINFNLLFQLPNIRHAIVLLLLLGVYMSSASIYTQYASGVLGYTNLINAKINLWMIPGILVAGSLAYYGFKYRWPVKFYIMLGFISFFLHVLSLYLIIQPQMDIFYLQLSTILKGLGMGILFIGIWFYGSQNIPARDMFGVMSILIMIRSYFAAAVGSAIIAWATYHVQWQSLNDIAMYMDSGDVLYNDVSFPKANIQATLSALKIVLGCICWSIVPILLFIWTHHYGKFNIRRIVFLRKIIKGSVIKGYRLS